MSYLLRDQCGWCGRPFAGRHRRVEPFAFRGWCDHQPIRLDVPLVFHGRCWRMVKRIAGAAESWAGERPTDPPLTYCDQCGADTYPATDHYCPRGAAIV